MIAATVTDAALGALIVVMVGGGYWYTRKRLQEIHVLVNRRLEVALQEIRELKQTAKETTADTAVTTAKQAVKDKDQAVKDQAAKDQTGSAPVVPSDAGRIDDG